MTSPMSTAPGDTSGLRHQSSSATQDITGHSRAVGSIAGTSDGGCNRSLPAGSYRPVRGGLRPPGTH
jgi:hypothetical protein